MSTTDPTFATAARLGFPALTLRAGIYLRGGETGWRWFCASASSYDRVDANMALAALEQAREGA